ncbi:MAG TPA: hypothetical protein VMV03_04910 [Spirochaetia bacterium]|nr:hypothetical protein [Spirochaetia bacterium]
MRFPALAALAACCLGSCAPFGGDAELEALLPRVPAHWAAAFPDLHFRLVLRGAAGDEQALEIPSPPARITCSKATNTAILAYPVSARAAGFLRPAGAVYPLDLRREDGRDTLRFSWEAGAAAWVLSRLRTLGFETSLVNAPRLRAELARHPDPWALDLEKIAEKLADGTFIFYDIDLLPSRDVQLRPGVGSWFLEDPESSVTPCRDEDTLLLPALSVGDHALFSIEGRRIRISVGAKETVIAPRE